MRHLIDSCDRYTPFCLIVIFTVVSLCVCFNNNNNNNNNKALKPAIGRLWGIQMQKEVKSNPKQPSCKKSAALRQAMVKKDVKSKVAAKKWL